MNDIFCKEKRSFIMSRVRSSRNSSTELKLISVFKGLSIKCWRRNYRVKGNPDFVFHKRKIVVFTDGCFWHGHDCRNTKPKDNEDYWQNKISKNRRRDQEITEHLKSLGYTVIRIWECELNIKNGDLLIEKLAPLLNFQK
jgi:DNA mismatch endonuclease (patch repair protein)